MNTQTPTSSEMNAGYMNSRFWDTLDEPIWDTVYRDISSIGLKLKHILIPSSSDRDIYLNVCKNWDLWGPFIFCTYISFSLNNCGEECGDRYDHHQSNFSSIFVFLWLGNLAICLNFKLLLKNSIEKMGTVTSTNSSGPVQLSSTYPMSIFQMLCLFGYSLAVPCVGLLALQLMRLFSSSTLFYERVIITTVFGFIYPAASTLKMLSTYISSGKYFLVVFPILMFYTILSLYMYTIV